MQSCPSETTVTLQLPYLPLPSFAVAVIAAVPFDTAQTLPFCVTDTTASSEDAHTIDLSAALEGDTMAVNRYSSNASSDKLLLFKLILVTGCTTVTVQDAVFSPTATRTVAVPTAFAVIIPILSTVTMLVSLLFHTTSSVKSFGVTFMTRVCFAPVIMDRLVLPNVISSAFTSLFTKVAPI